MCVRVHLSEGQTNNLWELTLSFCHMGSWDQTQVVSLGGKLLYMLSHLTGPEINYVDILVSSLLSTYYNGAKGTIMSRNTHFLFL